MPYIIDGHNLIPKIPGLSLDAMDDEMQLVQLLQEFCQRTRKEVEVYFDNAPAGQMRARTFGLVLARFVRQGVSADDAIRARLTKLGNVARNWTVVSSDHAVQTAARAARARVLSSEEFSRLLINSLSEKGSDAGSRTDQAMGKDELTDWLHLFGSPDED
jgi:predicted RNA-binding protein with PIN domain